MGGFWHHGSDFTAGMRSLPFHSDHEFKELPPPAPITMGLTPSSTRTHPALPSALSQLPASWAPLLTSVQGAAGKLHPIGNPWIVESPMPPPSNSTPNYQVEFKATHADRPGFRINELRISPTQFVPWHYHNHIQDTFYVLEGRVRILLSNPEEMIELGPSESYSIPPLRPHLVTNAGESSATFLNLQGMGEYDFIPFPGTHPSHG